MNDPYRPSLTVVYGSIYSKVEDYKLKTKHTLTLNINKRKWQQPQFHLDLIPLLIPSEIPQ